VPALQLLWLPRGAKQYAHLRFPSTILEFHISTLNPWMDTSGGLQSQVVVSLQQQAVLPRPSKLTAGVKEGGFTLLALHFPAVSDELAHPISSRASTSTTPLRRAIPAGSARCYHQYPDLIITLRVVQ
jgi:hypothetical protein